MQISRQPQTKTNPAFAKRINKRATEIVSRKDYMDTPDQYAKNHLTYFKSYVHVLATKTTN